MKINSDQKSVLLLAGLVFFGVISAGAQYVFNIEAMVVWLILGAWFYGVRTKKKPAEPPPLPRS